MPGNLLTADSGFPDLKGEGSVKEKLDAVAGYLYTLLEQLRYTLNNLGEENFNGAELDHLGKVLTGPLRLRVENAEGELFALTADAGKLTSQVRDLNGRVSGVEQDVNGLNVQTEGGVTYITGEHVKTGSIVSQNGLSEIDLNTGMARLSGSYQMHNPETGEAVGGICYDTNGAGTPTETKNRMFLYTDNGYGMKLRSSGNLSLEGEELVYVEGGRSVVLTAGKVRWRFGADGIYCNDVKVISPPAG